MLTLRPPGFTTRRILLERNTEREHWIYGQGTQEKKKQKSKLSKPLFVHLALLIFIFIHKIFLHRFTITCMCSRSPPLIHLVCGKLVPEVFPPFPGTDFGFILTYYTTNWQEVQFSETWYESGTDPQNELIVQVAASEWEVSVLHLKSSCQDWTTGRQVTVNHSDVTAMQAAPDLFGCLDLQQGKGFAEALLFLWLQQQ